ncbi:hypothetical protein [Gordonia oryzae]|uniref:hypothetical protein n=1 Tax=Gordonia oryzae TaxID=2487349 RepID=UPI001FEBCB5B|nr:hypothetical protein [Gordonia oryzae]
MPHTPGDLEGGDLTEWRAAILVRETAYLTGESREEIDRVVANADGTCVAHNRAKEADGPTYTPIDTEYGHILDITTPTGAWHRSLAPNLVGRQPERR